MPVPAAQIRLSDRRRAGARRRRDAALARAAQLDGEADRLEADAEGHERDAAALDTHADRIVDHLTGFPKRKPLRDAEGARVAAVTAARVAEQQAADAETMAAQLLADAAEQRRQWVADVIGAGLPADLDHLGRIARSAEDAVKTLRDAVRQLTSSIRKRLVGLADAADDADFDDELTRLLTDARAAFDEARQLRATYDELLAQQERSLEEVFARHAEVKGQLEQAGQDVAEAAENAKVTAAAAAGLAARLEEAEIKVREAEPHAAQQVVKLRSLLNIPGAATAVLSSDPEADAGRLLRQVGDAVDGRVLRSRASPKDSRSQRSGMVARPGRLRHYMWQVAARQCADRGTLRTLSAGIMGWRYLASSTGTSRTAAGRGSPPSKQTDRLPGVGARDRLDRMVRTAEESSAALRQVAHHLQQVAELLPARDKRLRTVIEQNAERLEELARFLTVEANFGAPKNVQRVSKIATLVLVGARSILPATVEGAAAAAVMVALTRTDQAQSCIDRTHTDAQEAEREEWDRSALPRAVNATNEVFACSFSVDAIKDRPGRESPENLERARQIVVFILHEQRRSFQWIIAELEGGDDVSDISAAIYEVESRMMRDATFNAKVKRVVRNA